MDSSGSKTQRRKDKIVETHKDGQRVRYFPDDDKYTLKNMVIYISRRNNLNLQSAV